MVFSSLTGPPIDHPIVQFAVIAIIRTDDMSPAIDFENLFYPIFKAEVGGMMMNCISPEVVVAH
jgi:hypothetical protein